MVSLQVKKKEVIYYDVRAVLSFTYCSSLPEFYSLPSDSSFDNTDTHQNAL